VALGIIAASAQNHYEFEALTEHDDPLEEEALLAVINSQRREIFECLRNAYGDEFKLCSRLWHTGSALAEKDSEGDEWEVTDANSSALEYVRNGFHY
jgi:hypothetical protein